ncbi:unnamed protein product [Closterium sp. NIES-64]|nr:unnamed protein product [Closterium sp. NIES-64]
MSDPKVSASEAEEARSEAREPLGAQQAVMIFVKRPAPGRVKTRLAAGVGADAACDFYRACCEHVVTNIARCPDLYVTIARHASTHVFIFFSEPSDEGEIRRWMQQLLPSSTSLRFVPQVGGDVGARMQAAFQHVLGLGYQRVVVIGTDIPDVDGVTVAAALSALRNHQVSGGEGKKGTTMHHQVVFGPALDGGYYLLGLTAVLPCLFHVRMVLVPFLRNRLLQQSHTDFPCSSLSFQSSRQSLAATPSPAILPPPSFTPPTPSLHRVEHGQGAAAVAHCTALHTNRIAASHALGASTQFNTPHRGSSLLSHPPPSRIPHIPSGNRVEPGQGVAAVTLSSPHKRGG